MKLSSPAFDPEDTIPRRYTGDGEDLSPPLEWTDVPDGTAALALICEDPDAPRAEPWVHWLLYDLPGDTRALPEGLKANAKLGHQGHNTFEKTGYGGPAPPPGHGRHHYIFTLYALKKPLGLKAGASKAEVCKKIEGNALATATLVGIYERK